jgi:hypothetical protein
MIRRIAVSIVLLMVIFLPGCDDSSTTPLLLQSLEGTWLFPDQVGYTEISTFVAPDDATTGMADIGWTDGNYSYWCYGDGPYADSVLTRTYSYNRDDSSEANLDTSGLVLSIQITFTLDENNRLSFSCSGDGPLDGKTFTGGILQPSV